MCSPDRDKSSIGMQMPRHLLPSQHYPVLTIDFRSIAISITPVVVLRTPYCRLALILGLNVLCSCGRDQIQNSAQVWTRIQPVAPQIIVSRLFLPPSFPPSVCHLTIVCDSDGTRSPKQTPAILSNQTAPAESIILRSHSAWFSMSHKVLLPPAETQACNLILLNYDLVYPSSSSLTVTQTYQDRGR